MFLAIDTIKNHRLSFIPVYSSPISPSRLISGSLALWVYCCHTKVSFTSPCSLALRRWGWGSPADLLTYVTLGEGLQLFRVRRGGRRILTTSSRCSPAAHSLLMLCLPSCVSFDVMYPFMRSWGLKRKLSPWASENPRHKLFPLLWGLWPWICAVGQKHEQPPGFIHKRCTFCPGSGPSSPKGSTAGVCSSLDALLLCLSMPNLFLPSPEAICKWKLTHSVLPYCSRKDQQWFRDLGTKCILPIIWSFSCILT